MYMTEKGAECYKVKPTKKPCMPLNSSTEDLQPTIYQQILLHGFTFSLSLGRCNKSISVRYQ